MKMRDLHAKEAPFTTVNQILDALKKKLECPSENALAERMDWYPSKLRNYRKGRSRPADVEAMQIAKMLEVDDAMVVAICHAEREENAQVKAMWLHLAKQRSRFIGPALALAFAVLAPPPAHASTSADVRGFCIFCQTRRRRRIVVDVDRRWRPDRRRSPRPAAAVA